MSKPKKQMVILGVRDSKGNKVEMPKRYLAMHYQPKNAVENFKVFYEEAKNGGYPEEFVNLFQDILTLSAWAAEKLPLVKPPKVNSPS